MVQQIRVIFCLIILKILVYSDIDFDIQFTYIDIFLKYFVEVATLFEIVCRNHPATLVGYQTSHNLLKYCIFVYFKSEESQIIIAFYFPRTRQKIYVVSGKTWQPVSDKICQLKPFRIKSINLNHLSLV